MEKFCIYLLEKNCKDHNASAVIEVSNELFKFVTTKEGHLALKKTNRSSLKSNDYLKMEVSIEAAGSFQHMEAGMKEAIAYTFSDIAAINERLEEVPVEELMKSSNIVLG